MVVHDNNIMFSSDEKIVRTMMKDAEKGELAHVDVAAQEALPYDGKQDERRQVEQEAPGEEEKQQQQDYKQDSPPANKEVPPLSDALQLNTDKTKTVLVRTSGQDWITTSLSYGVSRRLIERTGGDIARATTVVKFEPNQTFPSHTHTGGEEFIVLSGAWRDRYGVFPKYSYIRNYIGSEHAPLIGEEGVVILVKLCQMCEDEHLDEPEPEHRAWTTDLLSPENVKKNGKPLSSNVNWGVENIKERSNGNGNRTEAEKIGSEEEITELQRLQDEGGRELIVFKSTNETVKVMALPANRTVDIPIPRNDGRELFVIDGSMTSRLGTHDEHSWARIVGVGVAGQVGAGSSSSEAYNGSEDTENFFRVQIGPEEVYLYSKEGHLSSPEIDLEKAKQQELALIAAAKAKQDE
ncbi:unnamed protein product [Amoebophrya sp. A25]|nr:unnamed protein product [Amoebophrya sp. A25]|eukprot:GSA25T00003354001.1